MSDAPVLATLIGHRQMGFAVPCLASLRRFCRDPFRLRVHDDGTLTPADRLELEERLAASVLSREEADEVARRRLVGFPASSGFRAANPLALKLLDVAFHAEENIFYCDADILFLRPFAGLFTADQKRAIFMVDTQDAYSVRPWHLVRWPRLRLAGRLNSGIIVAPRSAWKLERIEWLLGLPGLRPSVWLEQTCWAALGGLAGAQLLDAGQFAIAGSGSPTSETIAMHFVSPSRGLLPDALRAAELADGPQELPVATARSQAAGRCSVLDLAWAALNRKRKAARARSSSPSLPPGGPARSESPSDAGTGSRNSDS